MDKIEVNGTGEAPLYTWLKSQSGFKGFGKGLKAMMLGKLAKKRDKNYKESPTSNGISPNSSSTDTERCWPALNLHRTWRM